MSQEVSMKNPHLVSAGKGLAGAGLTGIVGYLAGTASDHSWPFWPFLVFTAMMAVGVAIYFSGQGRPAGRGEAPGRRDASRGRAGPAYTGRWRHTVNGAGPPGLDAAMLRGFSHPGYLGRVPGDQPPSLRIAMIVTCDPLGTAPTTSDLRDNFLSFLRRPPVWKLIRSVTDVGDDLGWRSYASNGRLNNEAVLTCREDQQEAPVASAMMILSEPGMPGSGSGPGRRAAQFVLHIEPRGDDGRPAAPAGFQSWYDSLVRVLAVPGAFAEFLTREAGVATYADPPAGLGVRLRTRSNIGELVDPGGLRAVTGSWPSRSFVSHLTADPGGEQAADVAGDLLIRICDHALHLRSGYEDKLARLQR